MQKQDRCSSHVRMCGTNLRQRLKSRPTCLWHNAITFRKQPVGGYSVHSLQVESRFPVPHGFLSHPSSQGQCCITKQCVGISTSGRGRARSKRYGAQLCNVTGLSWTVCKTRIHITFVLILMEKMKRGRNVQVGL